MKIHVIGAGNVGGHIARAAARAGHRDRLGPGPGRSRRCWTRPAPRSRTTRRRCRPVTLPHAVAAQVLPKWDLAGKVLVDTCNPPTWAAARCMPRPEGHGSAAAHLQSLLPDARVVKAFNTFGAEHSSKAADAEHVAGDDAEAKAVVWTSARSGTRPPWSTSR